MTNADIKYDDKGLVPAIAQDCTTGIVLMLAYMNRESLEKTMMTGKAHYWSRSRNKLWLKGESSGNFQIVKEILYDCDQDSILLKVDQQGNACHTGQFTCFSNSFQRIGKEMRCIKSANSEILQEIYDVILDRTENPKEGSYTNYLFEKGLDKMLKKIGEESAEVIIAAKNQAVGEIVYEVSDLLFHILVVLVEQGIELRDIYDELQNRR